MPIKPNPTPDSVTAELAAAEAEHRRLSDKSSAIQQAGDDTRRAVELAELHLAYRELPDPTREAAVQALTELEALAAAPELDLQALLTAFDKRQRLDAEAGAVQAHVSALDRLDPLPDNAIGAMQTRTARVNRRLAGQKFSDYLDAIITRRENAAYNARVTQLRTDLEETVDAAESVARRRAPSSPAANGSRSTPRPDRRQVARGVREGDARADRSQSHRERHQGPRNRPQQHSPRPAATADARRNGCRNHQLR